MRTSTLSIVLGLATFGVGLLHAEERSAAKEACSLATLKGSYTYRIQGYRDGKPYASSGFFSFDGKGQVLNLYANSVEREQRLASGTYRLDETCAGSMTLDETTVNQFYVSPAGDGFVFVRVSGDGVIGTESRRVTRELLVTEQ